MHRSVVRLVGTRPRDTASAVVAAIRGESAAGLRRIVGRALARCLAAVECVAFWVAALLPVAYVPLYAALRHGLLDPGFLLAAAAINLLALVVGHRHDPGRRGGDHPSDATTDRASG